ncbi:MAG: hypothetical protein A2Y62_02440 [Candidatus Fischerbacteria bacterium RBG_13_37_8]|uniref:Uncharacterized protein n=1 Tax=Candidatus Fischerbacteria bacterium RBG_13_37_8 TaxID=1817863 RepID=A0A1F5VI15_9BACT|nr:MAG: hypothetical protein A2Y62_02440 [Candidatus Fischerbacteria bacterium RBG_13_37_8]
MKPDPKKVDKDLAEIDVLLGKLKLEWDRYFGGGARVPPFQFQKVIEDRFRRYLDTSELSYSQIFRLNTIQGKFTSIKDRFERMLRFREEGLSVAGKVIPVTVVRSADEEKERPEEQKAEKEQQSHAFSELFDQYVAARKQCGESVVQLKIEAFADNIKKQKAQIKEKLRGRDVEFYVAIENGKTKLKARPK